MGLLRERCVSGSADRVLLPAAAPQPLYEGWFLALFNLLYTTLPVLYIGLFEQVSSPRPGFLLP